MAEIDDVLIIGAGLAGIGMACHLVRTHPELKVRIIERRAAMGGTWDLFRYPGIRSDSEMSTFGYDFRPWRALKTLADGPSIKRYIEDTARQYGIQKCVSFGLKCLSAHWSSTEGCWEVRVLHEASGEARNMRCRFLISATGFYNFDRGYSPEFAGIDNYRGQLIHPQHWPEHFSCAGKRVVVIGSGATAVTLVPALARDASKVTMLQRSPAYMLSLPGHDNLSEWLLHLLPPSWVYVLARRLNLALVRFTYRLARKHPQTMRRLLLGHVQRRIGDSADIADFTPRYQPWDQRMCIVKDGDLFAALRDGRAEVLTDEIACFTPEGLLLKSGREIQADVIVTATGLQLQALGGMSLYVDGKEKSVSQLLTYKATLVDGIPNFAWLYGYINAAWTLKIDLAASYLCRLLAQMKKLEADVFVPRAPAGEALDENIMGLKAGYVMRGGKQLPRQGRHAPWRVTHDYVADTKLLLEDPVADTALELSALRVSKVLDNYQEPVLV
jgi:monooxygenase